ncbi:hypothetical protein V2J09_014781 [Rumex salicifolius]
MHPHEEDEQDGEIFLDESDILHEIPIDDEELPDAEEDEQDEPDDSLHIFTGHTEEVFAVACSPTDATLVATGGSDDRGFMWKVGQGDWAFELEGHAETISSIAFSYDGQLIASASLDGVIKIWDVTSLRLKHTLEGPGGDIEWIKWHPRGHVILAGSADCTVWMWNADSGAYLHMFSGHGASVTCGDFTPDGKLICTGSDDATLRVWNPKSAENIHVVTGYPYHTEGLTCLSLSADSTLALTGSQDNSVHLVNIVTGKVVSSLVAHTASIECAAFSPSGIWAATGSADDTLIVWDVQHAAPRCTCQHEGTVTSLEWLGKSKFIATASMDGKVRIWDSLSGDCVKVFSGHTEPIQSMSVSANDDYIVSVSLDKTARAFEIDQFK